MLELDFFLSFFLFSTSKRTKSILLCPNGFFNFCNQWVLLVVMKRNHDMKYLLMMEMCAVQTKVNCTRYIVWFFFSSFHLFLLLNSKQVNAKHSMRWHIRWNLECFVAVFFLDNHWLIFIWNLWRVKTLCTFKIMIAAPNKGMGRKKNNDQVRTEVKCYGIFSLVWMKSWLKIKSFPKGNTCEHFW